MKYVVMAFLVLGLVACQSKDKATASLIQEASAFNGEWITSGLLMTDSVISFNRLTSELEDPDYQELFIIQGSELSHEIRTEMGFCGNGVFYLDSASFISKKNEVEVILHGGYLVESTLEYQAKYVISDVTENRFVLTLRKVFVNELKSIYELD